MTLLERLRRMAECLPPGASVTLARDWLLDELDREAVQSGDAGDLTVPQLCALLGRKPSTVRAMCARGDLRAYRYRGAEWRAAPDAVTEYLAHERQGASGPRSDGEPAPTGNLSAWRHVRAHERKSA
jgi:excisionase family DNA binding protein